MSDILNFDEATMATLMPEQLLMAAIIRRAVADLPLSSRFFETDNGMFQLCCEALGMNPDEVRSQVVKKLKARAKKAWWAPFVYAV